MGLKFKNSDGSSWVWVKSSNRNKGYWRLTQDRSNVYFDKLPLKEQMARRNFAALAAVGQELGIDSKQAVSLSKGTSVVDLHNYLQEDDVDKEMLDLLEGTPEDETLKQLRSLSDELLRQGLLDGP